MRKANHYLVMMAVRLALLISLINYVFTPFTVFYSNSVVP